MLCQLNSLVSVFLLIDGKLQILKVIQFPNYVNFIVARSVIDVLSLLFFWNENLIMVDLIGLVYCLLKSFLTSPIKQ